MFAIAAERGYAFNSPLSRVQVEALENPDQVVTHFASTNPTHNANDWLESLPTGDHPHTWWHVGYADGRVERLRPGVPLGRSEYNGRHGG